jgi:hypothetical protein
MIIINYNDYNQDLYIQAGNMDWIKEFADKMIKELD